MSRPKWFVCFLALLLAAFFHLASSSVVEVDQEAKSSLEAFLKAHSSLRMDSDSPLKAMGGSSDKQSSRHETTDSVSSPLKTKKETKTRKAVELAEEALRLIYHELYEVENATGIANATDILGRYRSLSPRQSFLSGGLSSASEYVMSMVENSLEDMPSLPRLEAQECMKRSVCEAHNQPKKYGLIGLVLQLLFPPYTKSEEPTNTISKYQLAARYGRQSNANCGVQYDGCMLNLLDIVQALVNAFIR